MSDCKTIDPLITPYVDDDIDAAARLRVDDHVRRCPPCHSRVTAERAVRELVRTRRAEMSAAVAPGALRARCASLRVVSPWRARVRPLAIAAGLLLATGAVIVYEATDRSTRVLAAELTADHVKCFGVVNSLLGTNPDTAVIERAMESTFGWQMHAPEAMRAELELIGARPCFYARGKAAHLMYRHHGQPLSVFMLPQPLNRLNPSTHPNPANASSLETVDVMGHEAAVWSDGGRTFVLVAREPEQEVQRVAAIVQASLH